MNQQPRDVTGGEAVWGAMIPGLGLVNYIWGLLTVPAEVFLRRNFGERWFTQANFIGGLIILLLIQFISFLIGLFNPLGIIAMVLGHSGAQTVSWMAKITRWYVILGIGHFLVIWWRNVTGTAPHSFSAGESWLRPIGRAVMWVLNLFLDNVVRLIFNIHPKLDKRRLDIILPVLTDVDTFTERWIEPAFVMFIALFAAAAGQSTVFFWLVSSAMALNMYNGIRHQHQRGLWLNMQDAMIEADYYNQVRDAERKAIRKSYERMVKRAAYEVQQNPDMAKIIERTNPSLADAIRAINPTPHREANPFTPGDQQQAA